MATELFLPSPFPISVTHYPLKNRAAASRCGDQVADPFPSWKEASYDIALLSLSLFLTLSRRSSLSNRVVIAVLHYKYRKLPPGYTVSL